MKICVISANFGEFDRKSEHVQQAMAHDYFMFTEENFPLREKAMTPRLQAKIPKFFGWQLAPGYDYYLWIDGGLFLSHPDSLKYFYDNCQDYDIVALKHNKRPDIRQEARYTRKGVKQRARYLYGRYKNELVQELYDLIHADKNYVDDFLLLGGIFMYKNTPEVQEMMRQWWYYVSRYCIQDQISFPYVLKKSGVKINVMQDIFKNCSYIGTMAHRYHSK